MKQRIILLFIPFFLSAFCFLPFALQAQTKADTIHVSHYNINLEIRNFAQQEINGYTDVNIVAKIAPIPDIGLDFLALTVDSVKNGSSLIAFSHQGQNLRIDLPFSFIGHEETIRIYYRGKPARDPQWGGFYFTSDFAYNMGVGMGSLPHSFGRVWFPCIDDFNDKSTYTFNIITDVDKKAICGGILVDSTNLGDAMRWTWELTDPIPTYLASVAVGNYQIYKDTVHSISGEVLPVEIYANSDVMPRVSGSFVNLKTFFHTFEKRWGTCRWQRIGYVVVPFNGGAMEHATNIGYPQFAVTGTTAYESLIAHELAHFWFGNLITCSTSQNMWINEGFARYGEYLCYEILDPTLQTYKTEIRKLHMDVLKNAHNKDGGYFALDNIPPHITYGTTTYDKGGLVAYTLRHYMGDELYFSSIKQFLDENKYKNVDSEEFFYKLSQISGMDLHDFFLGWVHQPGFLNFNIDSVKPKSGNIYNVAFKQRLHHAHYFADNNKVDVEFVSASGERLLIERIQFSGESEIVEVEIPFEPVFWAVDPNEKMGDACFDVTQAISNTGSPNLSGDLYFRIQVTEVAGEFILRIEHNPFAPTPAKNEHPNLVKISEKHFWRVGFLQYNIMQAQYSFLYDPLYDKELLQGYTRDNLVLLYRKDAAHDWQMIPTVVTGNNQAGRLTANFILPGEYTLGICNNVNIKEWEKNIEIYPNPVANELQVISYELQIENIEIYDALGRTRGVIPNEAQRREESHAIDVAHLSSGAYYLKITFNNKTSTTKKFIKL
ncbi:MAG: T9SS type A sorting domain-containing protein [Bacteroidetes bacterium]|nr:T9SS type A sorting domain-containing protein [Bacteroidota bacterium]MCL2301630.1 T9SS type A sorting domain-containing protein [Lentimicrobiaceae bacterium]